MQRTETTKILEELRESGRDIVSFDDEVSFSNRLRVLADEKGVSIKNLASDIQMSYSSAWNLFEDPDVNHLRKTTLEKLSNYFDVDIDYLLCKQAEKRKTVEVIVDDRAIKFYDYQVKKNKCSSFCNFTNKNTSFILSFHDKYQPIEEYQESIYKGLLIKERVTYLDPNEMEWILSASINEHGVPISKDKPVSLSQSEIDELMRDVSEFVSFKLMKIYRKKTDDF